MGFLTISLACTALGLALATPLSAQALNEAEMIRRVEQLSVSRLDSTLAEQPFAAWFRSTVGAAARIEYEVDDCGEQTGNPAVDAGRDFPACVSAYADLADGRQVGVSVVAGTLKQGLVYHDPGAASFCPPVKRPTRACCAAIASRSGKPAQSASRE